MRLRQCLLSALLCLLLGGCGLEGEGLNTQCYRHIHIDQPIHDTHTMPRRIVAVMAHSTSAAADPMWDYQLIVREERDVFPSDYEYIPMDKSEIAPGLLEMLTYWVPNRAGIHKIYVISTNMCAYSSVIAINVDEDGRGGAAETQTPVPTALPPTAMPLVMSIQFWTGANEIVAGGCTRLHWDVVHADRVYLDGELVPESGSREVCPTSNTTYTIRSEGASGTDQKSQTITVREAPQVPPQQISEVPPTVVVQPPPVVPQPADTTGPQITAVGHTPASLFDNPACGAAEALISARVEDPSGFSTVEVYYRVTSGSMQGAWRIIPMTAVGSGDYRAVMGQAQFKLSHPDFFNGIVEYQVKARDNKNNGSESGLGQIIVLVCIT